MSATAPRNSRLPFGLRVFADLIGEDGAMRVALHYGGTRIAIPRRARGSALAAALGLSDAERIVTALGGQRIEIPVSARLLNAWLRQQRGWSQERRCRQLHRSRRVIQRWDTGEDEGSS